MTVTTTYPGIYLSEDATPGFSVSGSATAVPAFVFAPENGFPAGGNIQVYTSWADFTAAQKVDTGKLYNSLKLWFMNGGGRCYLVHKEHIAEVAGQYDDITLLVAAGTAVTDISEGFETLVNGGYGIFGLFDGPTDAIKPGDTSDSKMKDYPTTPHGAAYYPWLVAEWAEHPVIPPSAAAAAIYAKTDRTRGPWKAPANVAINGVTPQYPVSDDIQGIFNQGRALNMIRTFPDAGTVIWGARTLDDSDNWRYIPVRRLFSMVERDIKKALNRLVFEPNSQPTWQRVKAAVDNYLYQLWRQGALAGNKESEAWFVQIGEGLTMTEKDVKDGNMIIKVGLAAVRPAEFILLQFSQDIAQ